MINYWYNTEFEMYIFGLPRYFNVAILNIFVQKTFILHSAISILNIFPLHDYDSTEYITIITEKAIQWCNCL